jgi:hypothetical protein
MDEMEQLIVFLGASLPEQTRTSVVHGDYRIDNMIFAKDRPEVLAVLDWELSTLGDPLADFTYVAMAWVTENGGRSGVMDLDRQALGIPELDEMVDRAVVVARGRSVSVETLNGPEASAPRARPWRIRALDETKLLAALDRQGVSHGPPEREGVQVELNTEEDAVALLAALVGDQVPVVSFQPSAGVLEQAYLALTEDRR